jgi:hypothetical protein
VPPLPPPPQEGGGRRSSSTTGSVALRGLGRKLVVLLVLGGLFSYLVLPVLIENLIAGRLQEAFGTPTKPDVEVSSNFPPELLLGRIDRIQVRMDQVSLQGFALYNARADLRGVNVSVPSLLEGIPRIESTSCSLNVEAPVVLIDQNEACLSYLGLGPV